ncbi:uncharacterized protein LOC131025559 [Salvia miltiorrhiza]|uniref:uncharacterized protein LOC131025559 n=1 Tax=Salvia miltiorrhiza TaxID=226208 RepID=UPI0025ACAFF2|nr:uncharacterized protein LOC131025559 [Salvia miltiorrhiza]
MGEWSDNGWEWRLLWNRDLREREELQLSELLSILNNHSLCVGKNDEWRWKPNSNGLYTVKSAYKLIRGDRASSRLRLNKQEFQMIWRALVPHKMKITAWRIVKGRVATFENLLRRHIQLPPSSTNCIFCKSHTEDMNHLFFTCSQTVEIWLAIIQWLGVQTVQQREVCNHFIAFMGLGNKAATPFLSSVWICLIWSLWKVRNECIFDQGSWNKDKMVFEIKQRLWSWTKVYMMEISSSNFHSWLRNPNIFG